MTTGRALERLRGELGELVEAREGPSLEEFAAYRDRPLAFIREELGGEPWSAQESIVEAVRTEPLVAIRSGNGAGKGWTLARLLLWHLYARRGLGIVTSATGRQVRDTIFREIRQVWAGAGLPGTLYESALIVDRTQDVALYGFSSDSVSRLSGYHASAAGGLLVLIDEAQGVEPYVLEGALACAVAERDRIVCAGNPLRPAGEFWRISQPSSGWRSLAIDVRSHPNIREGRVVVPGGPSPEFVERIAREYGRESGQFAARVRGEFPAETSEGLFRVAWIDEAVRRWFAGESGDEAEEEPAGPVVLAVDVGRHGPDESVVAVLRGARLERFEAWKGADLMESVDRVRRLMEAEEEASGKAPHVVVDEVGVGGGVLDRLRELGCKATGYNGGRKARDSDRYLNRRAEDFWHLREQLEAGAVALPPDEKLRGELVALSWSPTGAGQVQIQSKIELRGLIGRSPDRLDALCMAVAAARKAKAEDLSDLAAGLRRLRGKPLRRHPREIGYTPGRWFSGWDR